MQFLFPYNRAMRTRSNQAGFTLIEMIVSLALFSVVITIAVGALLVLIASNQRFQNEQSVMTNLSFALDSMTREIRTGTNYYCTSRNNTNGPLDRRIFQNGATLDSDVTGDCADGRIADSHRYHGIAFVEGGQSVSGSANTKIAYFYDATEQSIYRRVSGQNAQSIVSSGIVITDAEFYVTSSQMLDSGDRYQPMVTIYLEAKDSNDPTEKVYKIQTTITQRTLDL
jgi:prepilin-type N-terminal cleavage/methylation domain-containing protein